MSYERNVTITRKLYVSTCPKCGDRVEKEDNPPRQRLCKCGEWVEFKEESYTGPELKR